MTAKAKKISDIVQESGSIKCPARRTLSVINEFLRGPMCGRCHPCSFGSYETRLRMMDITEGNGSALDIETIRKIADMMLVLSMCKKGKDVASFVLEMLDVPSFCEHLNGICEDRECKALIEYRNVPENCIRCGLCQEACRFNAIIGEKQISDKCCFLPFEIRQKRCTKCGECIKVCPTNAIIVVNLGKEAEVMP